MTEKKQTTHNTYTACPIILEEGAGKKKKNNRFRWAFIEVNPSLIKHYNEIAEELKKAKFKYYLAGWHRNEIDENGKIKNDHIHIFVQWINPKELGEAFLRKIYYAHVSPHEDYNPVGIIKYIKCEDKKHKDAGITSEIIEEIGIASSSGKFPSMAEVKEMDREERQNLGPQYRGIIKEINTNEIAAESYLNKIYNKKKQIKITWIYGEGGHGKTQLGYMMLRDRIEDDKKTGLIYWDDSGMANLESDYKDRPEEINILFWNEFRDSRLRFDNFLQYALNEKAYRILYDNIYFRDLEEIIITSSQKPENIYSNIQENRKQIYRRITYVATLEDWNFDEQEPLGLDIQTGELYFNNICQSNQYYISM